MRLKDKTGKPDDRHALFYAARRRTWTRRRIVVVAVSTVLVCGSSIFGYVLLQRLREIQSNKWLGPVDWLAVCRSPSYMQLIWELAWIPADVRAAVPLRSHQYLAHTLSWMEPGALSLTLVERFEYTGSTLRIPVQVTNTATKDVLVTPIFASCDWAPGADRSLVWIDCLSKPPFLSQGSFIVGQGKSATVILELSVPKEPRPIVITFSDRVILVGISPPVANGVSTRGSFDCPCWEDVDVSASVVVSLDSVRSKWPWLRY